MKDEAGFDAIGFGIGIIAALIVALACVFMCTGCRTGTAITVRNSPGAHVDLRGNHEFDAGKTVQGELSPARALQLKDNKVPVSLQ